MYFCRRRALIPPTFAPKLRNRQPSISPQFPPRPAKDAPRNSPQLLQTRPFSHADSPPSAPFLIRRGATRFAPAGLAEGPLLPAFGSLMAAPCYPKEEGREHQ